MGDKRRREDIGYGINGSLGTVRLNARTLLIPNGAFMAVRGAVALDVPAEMVAAFAELAEPAEEW